MACHIANQRSDLFSLVSSILTEPDGSTKRQPGPASEPAQHRHHKIHLTTEQTEQLLADYRAGRTIREIAATFGLHRETVSNLLKRQSITVRYRVIDDEDRALAIRLYKSGMTLKSIGEQLNCHKNTIRRHLIMDGVVMRDSHGRIR